MQLRVLTLCEHIHPRPILSQRSYCPGPKLERHLASHIAAETVDTLFHPKTHSILLRVPNILVVIVQGSDVSPVILHNGISQRIPFIPVGRLGVNPNGIRRGVVCHPVKNYTEALCLRLGNKSFEILHRAKLRIHRAIVLSRVVGTECSLALFLANRVNRHKPDDIHSELFQTWKLLTGSSKSPFRGVLTQIHLINHRVISPFCVRSLFRAGNQQ